MAKEFINTRDRVYVVDGYAGWDKSCRMKIRVYCTRPYHAIFMTNMLIRPTKEELDTDWNEVDFTIFNAGEMHCAKRFGSEIKNETCVSVDLTNRNMVVTGSQYAGEMKKGVFGVCHYFFPKQGIVSLHASANEGEKGDVTLLFGLSGTGKTTLSADPKRKLIGDDEHCWSDKGIFNIEGGCYAKCIDLSLETEPDIFKAIKFGTVLENTVFYNDFTRKLNYHDVSVTENTRASYPLEHIDNAKFPAIGGHPKNIFFLTCDAYGVLPPVSKLTPEQSMYHFISGYTAKVAGTEVGIVEPVPSFSACFGEAFLPLHPTIYAEMLAEKMKKFNCNAWLINTGWTGGKYGVGHRFSLKYTRAIIDAIHEG
jgi:phosphoenolpyruvate carboxykinase (ATP)